MKETSEYINALEALSDPDPYRDEFHIGIKDSNCSVELEYGRLFRKYVLDKKPELILEIGTGWGYSTSWFLLGLNENEKGKIITIDTEENMPFVWFELGIPDDRLEFKIGKWHDIHPKIPNDIDLAFHDASHRSEHVISDMDLLLPKISDKGRIIVHDTHLYRGMGDSLKKYFEEKENWSYEEINLSCGIGIADKKGDRPI